MLPQVGIMQYGDPCHGYLLPPVFIPWHLVIHHQWKLGKLFATVQSENSNVLKDSDVFALTVTFLKCIFVGQSILRYKITRLWISF